MERRCVSLSINTVNLDRRRCRTREKEASGIDMVLVSSQDDWCQLIPTVFNCAFVSIVVVVVFCLAGVYGFTSAFAC